MHGHNQLVNIDHPLKGSLICCSRIAFIMFNHFFPQSMFHTQNNFDKCFFFWQYIACNCTAAENMQYTYISDVVQIHRCLQLTSFKYGIIINKKRSELTLIIILCDFIIICQLDISESLLIFFSFFLYQLVQLHLRAAMYFEQSSE